MTKHHHYHRQPTDGDSDDDRKPAARPTTTTAFTTPRSTPTITTAAASHITHLPSELQVNILTYLRAYELVAVHQVCRFYHDPQLIHNIVLHASAHVYPVELTHGFQDQPVTSSTTTTSSITTTKAAKDEHDDDDNGKKPPKTHTKTKAPPTTTSSTATSVLFTLEHLRNMELLVVARVLSRPEPRDDDPDALHGTGGYYVSKSWCKTALKWLELQHERRLELVQQQQQSQPQSSKKQAHTKKLSKRQQRLRQRKYSDASPPWPNVNADLLCEHQQLQRCSNRKSARARRRLLDQPSWRCLSKLYPESIPLASQQGECGQCARIMAMAQEQQLQAAEQKKTQRKAPLSQPCLRRFYTRTRGVPVQCLVNAKDDPMEASGKEMDSDEMDDDHQDIRGSMKMPYKDDQEDKEAAASGDCPLGPGLYVVLPRAWCHAWRRYMKTGEGGPLLPPDASALLCDAHRLALVPPHLEDYLYGDTAHLWTTQKKMDDSSDNNNMLVASPQASRPEAATRGFVVGLRGPVPAPWMDLASLSQDMAVLGLTEAELEQQRRAMWALERRRQLQQQQQQRREREQQQEAAAEMNDGDRRRASLDRESLDRENYCCVEILTKDEFGALEKLWPRQQGLFGLRFQVDGDGNMTFSTPPCRECDVSGLANACKIPKHAKASLRAAHQARVRKYAENKAAAARAEVAGSINRPELQLEY